MSLLPRKSVLAIAAVIDIAVHGRGRPVTAKILAQRYSLPARHLEPVLQALVRNGILRGIRGPRGGYELGRERSRITAENIVRAAAREEINGFSGAPSGLLSNVVIPALGRAEHAFSDALARITLDELSHSAEASRKSAG
ncbi:MAG: Rrf2 family transcriptional regulator [Xanthobacteraceae bacterium]|jgi:Rrf2 family transcriptional regulator, iron-sulfur cluster assembly transcription factor